MISCSWGSNIGSNATIVNYYSNDYLLLAGLALLSIECLRDYYSYYRKLVLAC